MGLLVAQMLFQFPAQRRPTLFDAAYSFEISLLAALPTTPLNISAGPYPGPQFLWVASQATDPEFQVAQRQFLWPLVPRPLSVC